MIKRTNCTAPALNQVTTKEVVPEKTFVQGRILYYKFEIAVDFLNRFCPGVRQSEVTVSRGSVPRHLIKSAQGRVLQQESQRNLLGPEVSTLDVKMAMTPHQTGKRHLLSMGSEFHRTPVQDTIHRHLDKRWWLFRHVAS